MISVAQQHPHIVTRPNDHPIDPHGRNPVKISPRYVITSAGAENPLNMHPRYVLPSIASKGAVNWNPQLNMHSVDLDRFSGPL
jgi:hypothetical protein